jgi:hypothetical protein
MATIVYTPTLFGADLPMSVASTRTGPVYEEKIIDFATAATLKGSALAAADIINAIWVPNESVILVAGVELLVPATATTTTIGVGTTASASGFVTGFDVVGGAANAYAPANSAAYPLVIGSGTAGGSVDVTLSTLTGTLSAGQIRVWAWVADVTDQRSPPIAQRKS